VPTLTTKQRDALREMQKNSGTVRLAAALAGSLSRMGFVEKDPSRGGAGRGASFVRLTDAGRKVELHP